MDTYSRTFIFERETKNTIRYTEDPAEDPPVIGVLYVQKWALGPDPPVSLLVTVQEEEQQ